MGYSTHDGDRTDEFLSGLRCAMSVGEIAAYVVRFPETVIAVPESPDLQLEIQHTGTTINCFFKDGRLRAVQVAWISSPMKRTVEDKRELCG